VIGVQFKRNRYEQNIAEGNYKAIFVANSIVSFADGFYYPLLLVFLSEIGGLPLMGLGMGIIIIFDSLGSFIAGELSDIHGRKPYLVASALISPVIYIAYPLLPLLEAANRDMMLTVLVIILIIDGVTDGVWDTVEAIYLGDITVKVFRGSRMGTYWGVGGAIFGAATIIAGFVGLHIDFLSASIAVALIYMAGIVILLRIKESTPNL
jgi:MFS family permease